MTISLGLFLLVIGVILSGVAYVRIRERKSEWISILSVFGGAFLFAICFMHLLPEIYASENHHHGEYDSEKAIGIAVLSGFLLQLFLEKIGGGHEHLDVHNPQGQTNGRQTTLLFLLGLCVHAFLEGMALIHQNHLEMTMFYGVFVHNIPLSMILMTRFLQVGYTKVQAFLFLSLFSIIGPLGALFGTSLTFLQPYYNIVLAVVIGVLLHVAASILYFPPAESDKRKYFLAAIVFAFALVAIIPEYNHV